MLKTISRSLFSLIFPVSCEICGDVLPARDGGICVSCESSLPLLKAPLDVLREEDRRFDRVIACCLYESSVKKILCALKFRRRRMLSASLLRLAARRLDTLTETGWDAVTAVPMPLLQRLERGFNQAELLAEGIAAYLEKPCLAQALSTNGLPRQQAKLDRSERRRNVLRRFTASQAVSGKKILLVDDILTTGETASECARALKEAGAASVDVFVIARGRP